MRILVAIGIALVIGFLGLTALRAVSARRDDPDRPEEPEDVADLSVYFVCRECGTEFQVTRLGETQVPRHCGEQMDVIRRAAPPGGAYSLN